MTAELRLRLESRTPVQAGTRLAGILGVSLVTAAKGLEIDLDGSVLEIVAGPSGSVDDRLRLPPDATGEVRAREDRSLAGHPGPPPISLVAVAIASVDTDRFAAERGWSVGRLASDRILGASVHAIDGLPRLLLVEPDTEGRIAASLARWGEGPAALYLRVRDDLDRARAATESRAGRPSAISAGPYGRSFVLGGGPIWGPHVVIVAPDPGARAARTIGA